MEAVLMQKTEGRETGAGTREGVLAGRGRCARHYKWQVVKGMNECMNEALMLSREAAGRVKGI